MMELRLFEAIGIELEYMIVARADLSIQPLSDQVLHAIAGSYESEVEVGEVSWSNELALHVIELKTTEPATTLESWPARFNASVVRINEILRPHGACLMPTGMHPLMTPDQFRVWPHEYNAVYEAFNRIFDCRGHGWSNLQSMHLNLPFAGDDEFGKLHAAIRVLLPILPALAASSPLMEGHLTGFLDTRLNVYRSNASRVPSIAGQVIPEPLFTRRDYEQGILHKIYADIAPHDPAGILQNEWLNARGAIARFGRSAIEIRVLDVQECSQADLAIAALVRVMLIALVDERWSTRRAQQAMDTDPLAHLLFDVCKQGEMAVISDRNYLALLGAASTARTSVQELWQQKLDEFSPSFDEATREALAVIVNQGPLARRIVKRLAGDVARDNIVAVYRELCECLSQNTLFQ